LYSKILVFRNNLESHKVEIGTDDAPPTLQIDQHHQLTGSTFGAAGTEDIVRVRPRRMLKQGKVGHPCTGLLLTQNTDDLLFRNRRRVTANCARGSQSHIKTKRNLAWQTNREGSLR